MYLKLFMKKDGGNEHYYDMDREGRCWVTFLEVFASPLETSVRFRGEMQKPPSFFFSVHNIDKRQKASSSESGGRGSQKRRPARYVRFRITPPERFV